MGMLSTPVVLLPCEAGTDAPCDGRLLLAAGQRQKQND